MAGNLARLNDLGIGKGLILKIISAAGILFLVSPLIILIIFSFNAGQNVSIWEGFSTRWYAKVFQDAELWTAIRNSFIIAIISTVLSTILGTMAALAVGKYTFKGRGLLTNILYIPTILPEIIFGVSLLALFLLIRMPLGFLSIICAHVTFSLSFVTLIVLTKLNNFDRSLEEASLDLGANSFQTLRFVVLPSLAPAIVSGALFAFTMSIDDFIVTFFTSGVSSATLPLKIYSLIKFGVTPAINAVSTVLLIFTLTALALANGMQKSGKINKTYRWALISIGGLVVLFFAVSAIVQPAKKRLYLYTYADYISADVIEDFEKEYKVDVTINYYNDNEELLSRLQMGASGYDLIFPSSYMVGILKNEGLLEPIDTLRLSNLKYIDPRFRKLEYDTTGTWYLPYSYGFSALVYNTDHVPEKIDSWSVMWEEKYRSNLIFCDDMFEVLFAGYKYLGYEMDDDQKKLDEVTEALIRQKPLLLKYENNMTQDYMIAGDVWIAQTWNGYIAKILKRGSNFRMAVPKEGILFFIDNICIPKDAPNRQTAELFIDFLLSPPNTARNIGQILYAMPNPAARALLPDSLRQDSVIFPPDEVLDKMNLTRDHGSFNTQFEKAWTKLKIR